MRYDAQHTKKNTYGGTYRDDTAAQWGQTAVTTRKEQDSSFRGEYQNTNNNNKEYKQFLVSFSLSLKPWEYSIINALYLFSAMVDPKHKQKGDQIENSKNILSKSDVRPVVSGII